MPIFVIFCYFLKPLVISCFNDTKKEFTSQDCYPLPRIDDVLDRLSGSKIFTTLDLKSGYWQVKLSIDSIPKTAFSTPDGHFEFLRLPFGLKNAPAEFSRIMFQVLGDSLKYIWMILRSTQQI